MIDIDTITFTKQFSICTLVTNLDEYHQMIASFHDAGFNEANSEFLYVNNTVTNKYDGYQGIKKFLKHASGTYIIVCHQDILILHDDMQILIEKIDEITHIDPHWAILGNAGYKGLTHKAIRISDPYGENTSIGSFPALVNTLDENFLVIRNDAHISISNDLYGFHFYGADLCLIANSLGYNNYVIDFHIFHKSGGTCNESFFSAKKQLISKYQRTLGGKFIRTTCAPLYLSSSKLLNFLYNKKFFISLKKRFENLYDKLS